MTNYQNNINTGQERRRILAQKNGDLEKEIERLEQTELPGTNTEKGDFRTLRLPRPLTLLMVLVFLVGFIPAFLYFLLVFSFYVVGPLCLFF